VSVAGPRVHTNLHKVDKTDTSSAEARPGSTALDGNPADDDPNLLNFVVVESGIACWMSSLLQMFWPDSGKLDCPVWHSRWFGFHVP
jgi:hypothetical protein